MTDKIFEPKNDGVDHINIYSKSKTELGRLLTNFSHTPFEHPKYGHFESVEGLWYYLRCKNLPDGTWSEFESVKVECLRDSHGFISKKLGRELLGTKIDTTDKTGIPESFKEDIIEGIKCKLRQNRYICKMMKDSDLPFAHYYFYGDENKNPKVYYLPEYNWIIELLEDLRNKLKEKQ